MRMRLVYRESVNGATFGCRPDADRNCSGRMRYAGIWGRQGRTDLIERADIGRYIEWVLEGGATGFAGESRRQVRGTVETTASDGNRHEQNLRGDNRGRQVRLVCDH